jgi:hypothetical protein
MNINEKLIENEKGFSTAMDCIDKIADDPGVLIVSPVLRSITRVLRKENPYTKARIELGYTSEKGEM